MKSRLVDTITNNEDHVRMRIFDGDLSVDDAASELIRLAHTQNAARIERLSSSLQRANAKLQYVGRGWRAYAACRLFFRDLLG
ncbi:hypothetical protein PSQ19_06065 [Devosia algicola]|uniref:Uncharacterized protein n=1 Tax=Devosia algicola TaxID=3026418 RepID=A0ABY7YQN0_9HYPH|nr:hypothetical protein [Devosia algicola]WDR03633.1 hypothetical protein PSQ19_06065 [Devosia algicola]